MIAKLQAGAAVSKGPTIWRPSCFHDPSRSGTGCRGATSIEWQSAHEALQDCTCESIFGHQKGSYRHYFVRTILERYKVSAEGMCHKSRLVDHNIILVMPQATEQSFAVTVCNMLLFFTKGTKISEAENQIKNVHFIFMIDLVCLNHWTFFIMVMHYLTTLTIKEAHLKITNNWKF